MSSTTARAFSGPPPPPLPEPKTIQVRDKCLIEYISVDPQTQPSESPESPAKASPATIVLVHGAPGSFRDFRHLVPLLAQQSQVRVVAVNTPGFGGSAITDMDSYLEHIHSVSAARLTYHALAEICGDQGDVFLLGHSYGSHTATHIAGFNTRERRLNMKGLALLAPAGFKPHRAVKVRTNQFAWQLFQSRLPLAREFVGVLSKAVYTKLLGFSEQEPVEHFSTGMARSATADWSLFREHLSDVERTLPCFLAWAQDDRIVEEEICLDVAAHCSPGPRFAFESGGHNIQKTKAAFLAHELTKWMAGIRDSNPQDHQQSMAVHVISRSGDDKSKVVPV